MVFEGEEERERRNVVEARGRVRQRMERVTTSRWERMRAEDRPREPRVRDERERRQTRGRRQKRETKRRASEKRARRSKDAFL